MNSFRYPIIGAIVSAVAFITSAAGAPATYTPTSLDGQNGWNGGIPCVVFVNNNPGNESVTTAAAYAGVQSWRYGRGYGSPGCGTPFSPQLPAAIGRPSSGSPADIAIVRFAFKAVTPGDTSLENIYMGASGRDDRTGIDIYLNNTAAGVELHMVSFEVTPPAVVADFVTKTIATVPAGTWHTVTMGTQYHENVQLDVTTYIIDEGTPGQVTFQAVSWPHPWRQDTGPNGCGGCAYTPGQSLKFADSNGGNAADNGFYFDDVSIDALSSATSKTVAFFGTGFEPLENVSPPALQPAVTKSFSPSTIVAGGTSTASFVITNPGTDALTSVSFTDTLPALMTVAASPAVANSCGGTVTAVAGSANIALTGASLAGGASCTVTVNVTAPVGLYSNTVQVTANLNGVKLTSDPSTAVLSVLAFAPLLSKSFNEVSAGPGNTVLLTFVVTNPNAAAALTGIGFNDPLPAGLKVANPSLITGACDGGTITALANTGAISLANATLAAGASCTFSVNVTADGTRLGLLTNTSGAVFSSQSPAGNVAIANIFIGDPFQITYAANLAIGDSYFDVTNAGTMGAGLNSVNLTNPAATTGAICANVYAFTPDEQMVSCCSCPVTPNGLNAFSAKLDLANNTLTAAPVSALVVKILATLPVGNSCANSAASVAGAALANGIKSYGTTIHATPAGTYGVTERPFAPATLSAGELSRLGNLCNFIVANGSGYGICNSCRLGGLGAERQ